MKIALGEYAQYEHFVEKGKQDNNRPLHLYMNIVPVNFGEKGKAMLANVKKLCDNKKFAIDPSEHAELLTDMRIATADEELRLDKKDYPMDLLDSLRLACEFIKY